MKQITFIVTLYEFSEGKAFDSDKLYELIEKHYDSEWEKRREEGYDEFEGAGWDFFVEDCGPLAESALSWHLHLGRFLRKLMRLGAPKPDYIEWNKKMEDE